MNIELHPQVAKVIMAEVEKQNKLPLTKKQLELRYPVVSPYQLVNDILWSALRSEDITIHYTRLK